MADQNFKTSFIPTKPIQPVSKGGNLGRTGHTDFLNLLTLIIFLAMAVVAGGVFVYKIQLESKVNTQLAELEAVRKTLDSPLINEADRLNTRIESVKVLLQNHLAPSELFALLEKTTLKTVQFINLNYVVDVDSVIRVIADGQALGYESIVLQSQQYGDTTYLRNILFSGLQPNLVLGGINYDLDGTVDGQLILYRKRLDRESSAPAATTQPDNSSSAEGESFEFPDAETTNNN